MHSDLIFLHYQSRHVTVDTISQRSLHQVFRFNSDSGVIKNCSSWLILKLLGETFVFSCRGVSFQNFQRFNFVLITCLLLRTKLRANLRIGETTFVKKLFKKPRTRRQSPLKTKTQYDLPLDFRTSSLTLALNLTRSTSRCAGKGFQ